MRTIITYLESLGLSSIEARLYLNLLASGPLTVRDLARAAKINRTATYSHITSLLEKGILVEIMRGSRKYLIAIEPDRLHYLIDNKLYELRAMDKKFPDIIQMINTTLAVNRNEEQASIKYYKGKDNFKTIYLDSFKAKELRSYVKMLNPHDPNKFFSDSIGVFTNAFKQNPYLIMKEIIYDSPSTLQTAYKLAENKRYSFKIMKENIKLSAQDILMYDGKVALINYEENLDAIVLQNLPFYKNSKELFDFIWNMLPEPTR